MDEPPDRLSKLKGSSQHMYTHVQHHMESGGCVCICVWVCVHAVHSRMCKTIKEEVMMLREINRDLRGVRGEKSMGSK